ncbi:hypothetical protein QFC21_004257 [Naganishia friedmannii]|uniref:Uncharacterized protein n=1 Tax=Naganishia friedmannii TaxID=89922 RepID=A0ACC2VI99_9TREE|nr:hypothetical protein QFC21_004257 [Naganishia friedmannii]
MSLANGSRTTAKSARTGTVQAHQAGHKTERQSNRTGGGWGDVWDSSSDPEDSLAARRTRDTNISTDNPQPVRQATAIAVPTPNTRNIATITPRSDEPTDNQPIRSSSYTHISPPSPSSYGPRADWTVLDETEITEAEKIYEAERQKRLQPTESHAQDPNTPSSPYTGASPLASVKGLPASGSGRTFGSGVAGLSKSFINIALGNAASHASSSQQSGKGKEREQEIRPIMSQRGMSTTSKRQACGRDAIRPDIDEILRDPMHVLKDPSAFTNSASSNASTPVDPAALKTPINPQGADICYSSVMPHSSQSTTAHTDRPRRARSIRSERRREKFAKVLCGKGKDRGGSVDSAELRRMSWSGIPEEFRHIAWQMLLAFGRGMTPMDAQSLERILYVRAMRNPASGYVQGINDLVTPFFEVFLGAYITCDPELFDVTHLPGAVLAAIEADCFWCLSKLLDGIQDNYITAQPGIHRLVRRMAELVKRIDPPLALHLEEQGVEFMQFAFRWMNCLLMREISVKCTIRMWDTYLEIIMFLQCLPTQDWQDHDIELLLSEAFVLKSVWQGAENHFTGKSVSG